MSDDIYIKDCGKYFTVGNKNGNYDHHAHIDNRKSAELLKKQIERKIVPKGRYFRDCALRVTIDENYKTNIENKILKDKNRIHYFNPNKGIKR